MNKIENGMKLDFSNVLIRPKRTTISSRSEVDLIRKFNFNYCNEEWKGVPIIAANMDTIGTFEVYDELSKSQIVTAFHKHYTPDDYKKRIEKHGMFNDNYFMISTGISEKDFEKLLQTLDVVKNCSWVCVDVANGYMNKLVDFCRKLREYRHDLRIVAGNVTTREMVEELILNGRVDVVKIGIGSGSGCLTRMKTGVGMPQLSAIIECADAAHGVGGHIISDGGITCPGDMAKAFGAGADFVMMGGRFAGHDENPGEIIEENGEKYKLFYGMSSKHAMEKHYGKMDNYRSSEGRCVKVKYKGPISETVEDYLGGLRSACSYINAKNIKNMPKCTTFVQVSQQLNTIYA